MPSNQLSQANLSGYRIKLNKSSLTVSGLPPPAILSILPIFVRITPLAFLQFFPKSVRIGICPLLGIIRGPFVTLNVDLQLFVSIAFVGPTLLDGFDRVHNTCCISLEGNFHLKWTCRSFENIVGIPYNLLTGMSRV